MNTVRTLKIPQSVRAKKQKVEMEVIQIKKSNDRARNEKCYCFSLNDGITVKHGIISQSDAVC